MNSITCLSDHGSVVVGVQTDRLTGRISTYDHHESCYTHKSQPSTESYFLSWELVILTHTRTQLAKSVHIS